MEDTKYMETKLSSARSVSSVVLHHGFCNSAEDTFGFEMRDTLVIAQ